MREIVSTIEPYKDESILPNVIHKFEVGRMYHYRFYKDKEWTHFRCTQRNGNVVTLVECEGNGRIFEGEVMRGLSYESGVNEYLDCGIERHGSYDKIIQIPARNYWYGVEC